MKKLSSFRNMMLWVHERFPLTNTPLFIVLYLASLVVADTRHASPAQMALDIVTGSIASVSFFLLLRVLDEHKDYRDDCINHPERVLQSGKITLLDLKVTGVACLAIQILLMLLRGGDVAPVLTAWLGMLFWTLLMTKEFFAARWLNQHFILYALSHVLIMPFFTWWMLNFAQPGITVGIANILLMSLSFVGSLSFEITRKCKGPDEERSSITTYSSLFGRNRAVAAVLFLQVTMIALEWMLIKSFSLTPPLWFCFFSLLMYLLLTLQLFLFLRRPVIANRKRNEAIVGLAMLSGYLITSIVIYLK